MRLTTLILLVTLMQVSAASMAQKISLSEKNTSLKEVCKKISLQSGYSFIISGSELKIAKPVFINTTDTDLRTVLDEIFKTQPLQYQLQDKSIIVSLRNPQVAATTISRTTAARFTVKGKVTDGKGTALVGVSIRLKNTTRGVLTDINGDFSIDASIGDILVVSYISFNTAEFKVTDQNPVRITLKELNNELNAVVVTALNIKRSAKSLTYNVQELKASDVNAQNDGNFVNNLAGKVAGATINTSSAGIGGSARVVLRGTKSLGNDKNNALYVIDGVPLFNFNGASGVPDVFSGANSSGDGISQLNQDDIETVSVLTGPAAAALYGNNASGGVILITTKKGAADKTSVNFSSSTSFFSPFVLPKFQNTYGSTPGGFDSWGARLATPSTYQPKDFFQTGMYLDNSVSLSTGTQKNQTYISAANTNGKGIIPNNELDRLNLTLRNTANFFNDKLTMDLGVMYVQQADQNLLTQGLYNNPLVPIYLFPRGDDIIKYQVYERYDATRNFKTQFWPFGDQGFAMQNPYWIVNRDINTNKTKRYLLNASAKYTINSWLNVVSRAKYDNTQVVNESKYYASTSGILAGPDGAYFRNVSNQTQTYADVLLNATYKLKDFSVNAFLGGSYDDRQLLVNGLGGNLITLPDYFTLTNVDLTSAKVPFTSVHSQNQAIYETAQFAYKSGLFLDITGRTDWNSALSGSTQKSLFYPSIGLSGVITDLFGINSNTLSYLKVRGSYSEVGTPPNPYLTNPHYDFTNQTVNTLGIQVSPTLQPERTRSYEVGINTRLFNNLISLDVTAYRSSTYKQIFDYSVTNTSGNGASTLRVNSGQVDNKGIEANLGVNARFGEVKWTSNMVFSLNRNKIRSLFSYADGKGNTVKVDSIVAASTGSYLQRPTVGGTTGDIYVNTLATDEHGFIVVDPRTRQVTAANNTYIYAGNADPRFNIGFRNSISYRNLTLGFLVDARIGGIGVSATQALLDRYGVSEVSAQARDAGGVMVNGGLVPAKDYYAVTGGGVSGLGAPYVYSATNVRLREATLSYHFPAGFFRNKLKGATLGLTGKNIFMFYNKAPFDPESTASTGTFYQGVDFFRQPSFRSIGFNVSVQF
ncbi:SusC/RagA family TonB-linked outer membrane protein [Mucilaginibacter flavus]|uniref:SusC/RagA family TonB-linked outer membrane protein n=1 Tax=Mucilaginibacter flavus TaxID=931504 RepID=UPI0025B3D773|nr:SusC/RagA family TonB-linked outer membrane protein [Mucilaginibacter flavus]MDN3584275.1 SusC/RagA family TonB-linked outer membrane protein [Mucilaginibacter flavus]